MHSTFCCCYKMPFLIGLNSFLCICLCNKHFKLMFRIFHFVGISSIFHYNYQFNICINFSIINLQGINHYLCSSNLDSFIFKSMHARFTHSNHRKFIDFILHNIWLKQSLIIHVIKVNYNILSLWWIIACQSRNLLRCPIVKVSNGRNWGILGIMLPYRIGMESCKAFFSMIILNF